MGDSQSKSLFQITRDATDVAEQLMDNGGELTPELEKALEVTETELAIKTDGYAHFLDRLDMERSFFKSRADLYNKAVKGINNVQKRLKDNLKGCMKQLDIPEVKGTEFRFKLSGAAPKLIISDEKAIPDRYFNEVVSYELDKKALAADLKKGVEVPGVELEQNFSLRKYINNKGDQ